jgi:hypothetical protein
LPCADKRFVLTIRGVDDLVEQNRIRRIPQQGLRRLGHPVVSELVRVFEVAAQDHDASTDSRAFLFSVESQSFHGCRLEGVQGDPMDELLIAMPDAKRISAANLISNDENTQKHGRPA